MTLDEIIRKWRMKAKIAENHPLLNKVSRANTLRECADDLEAWIAANRESTSAAVEEQDVDK